LFIARSRSFQRQDHTVFIRPQQVARRSIAISTRLPTVVKVCNVGDRPARTASMRADCPASMFFDHSLKCVLNMSGWSHLEPKQCKPLVTSPHLEAALTVSFENDGKWDPGLYGRGVTWKTTSNVPAGKMASMFEPACGKLNGTAGIAAATYGSGWAAFPAQKATSVTDTTGRFHHISNAYACDQSLFPTSGSANPVLTGLALARRVAEAAAA
jgi:hypothetical protein